MTSLVDFVATRRDNVTQLEIKLNENTIKET